MNSRVIKIIAIVAMIVDHTVLILFPDHLSVRIATRLCFPLFAFLIAYGMTKTRNEWKYLSRLFIFALISQAAYWLVRWEISFSWINVFFTLSAGVLVIILFRRIMEKRNFSAIFDIAAIFAVLAVAKFVEFDYGMKGVVLILLFYIPLSYSVKAFKIAALPALLIVCMWYPNWWAYLFSFVFLVLFVDRKLEIPKWERWAFYVFYPLHLVILYLIRDIL
jgi:hypothetical protein